MIQIMEDNIAKCATEIIDIKSMTNRLTAEQLLNKLNILESDLVLLNLQCK